MKKSLLTIIFSLVLALSFAMVVMADEPDTENLEGSESVTRTVYVVMLGSDGAVLYDGYGDDATEVLEELEPYSTVTLVEEYEEDGWALVETEAGGYGCIIMRDDFTIVETTQLALDDESQMRKEIVEYALSFLGTKYVWGGTTPKGFDCSGFVSYVYKNVAGIKLTHYSACQANEGEKTTREELKPGDLCFYAFGGGAIDHVAMYIGDGKILHASTERGNRNSGKVRITTMIPANVKKYVTYI